MNLLCAQPPTAVMVNGRQRRVHWGHRTAITILTAFEDETLTPAEKQAVMLARLYAGPPPQNAVLAAAAAVSFLNGGAPPPQNPPPGAAGQRGTAGRLFSWRQDANLIYSAMHTTHGVNLAAQEMHWWAFLALFMDLAEGCLFSRVVGLRLRRAQGRLTREERAFCAQNPGLVNLAGAESAAEAAARDAFVRALGAEG